MSPDTCEVFTRYDPSQRRHRQAVTLARSGGVAASEAHACEREARVEAVVGGGRERPAQDTWDKKRDLDREVERVGGREREREKERERERADVEMKRKRESEREREAWVESIVGVGRQNRTTHDDSSAWKWDRKRGREREYIERMKPVGHYQQEQEWEGERSIEIERDRTQWIESASRRKHEHAWVRNREREQWMQSVSRGARLGANHAYNDQYGYG